MSKCVCGACGKRVSHSGVFIPGHQPVGTSHDPLGKKKIANQSEAHAKGNAKNNPKNNAKNNPKNNAKVQEHARVENEKRIAKMAKDEDINNTATYTAQKSGSSSKSLRGTRPSHGTTKNQNFNRNNHKKIQGVDRFLS